MGLFLGTLGTRAVILIPDALPRVENISLDSHVFAFTFVLAVLTGILFGLAPALQTWRTDVGDPLKQGTLRASRTVRGSWLRSGLVITEVALSLVLLAGAGLLMKSFWRLTAIDPGFDAANVLTLRLRLADAKYRDLSGIYAFLREVERRVQAVPGVERVSLATGFPFGRAGENGYLVEGQPDPRQPSDWSQSYTQSVSNEYHSTLGITLLAGRFFTAQDVADSPPVVIVDDEFVGKHFPGSSLRDALHKRVRFGGNEEPWREIVGVVRHVRQYGLDEDMRPGIYRPWTQLNQRHALPFARAMDLIVKASVEPTTLVSAIQAEVQAVDRDQPLGNVRTLRSLLDQSIAPRRFSVVIVGVFAFVALLLGVVGLYGVLSYTVTQRSREIGIRMALGAKKSDVNRLIVFQGMTLAMAGVIAGLIAALSVTRLMASLLYGVSATDPMTFTGIVLLLLVVATVACYLPARRATNVDPTITLRYE
jgi:predicted permease